MFNIFHLFFCSRDFNPLLPPHFPVPLPVQLPEGGFDLLGGRQLLEALGQDGLVLPEARHPDGAAAYKGALAECLGLLLFVGGGVVMDRIWRAEGVVTATQGW